MHSLLLSSHRLLFETADNQLNWSSTAICFTRSVEPKLMLPVTECMLFGSLSDMTQQSYNMPHVSISPIGYDLQFSKFPAELQATRYAEDYT